ncbi:hypothetical protein CALVIDRAFT_394004 [Calocera viscosa TUFC12733]|uniref:Uncharacterized protein n=1 Tax=Calocera viscosa (strain TUFC12733) TaxID=1330018 RepID=A0A167GDC8_CALVF|nr:hypothetical protein CALVIDRAFT_394004 [Calocera viscosa TUFC12733]
MCSPVRPSRNGRGLCPAARFVSAGVQPITLAHALSRREARDPNPLSSARTLQLFASTERRRLLIGLTLACYGADTSISEWGFQTAMVAKIGGMFCGLLALKSVATSPKAHRCFVNARYHDIIPVMCSRLR